MAKLVYALLALVVLAAPASASAQASTPSKKTTYFAGQSGRYMVDGTWYFRQDAPNQGLGAHFERQTSLTGWAPVTVPNAWNATDESDQSARGSIGWDRKDFKIPRARRGPAGELPLESGKYPPPGYLKRPGD